MTTPLKDVVRVEMKTDVREVVLKSRTHEYKRGGCMTVEVIQRTVYVRPAALLSCGHWRRETGRGADISKAKRLACWKCARADWLAKHPEAA